MTHARKKNQQGQWITHNKAGKAKDPKTHAQLHQTSPTYRREQRRRQGRGGATDPAGNPLPGGGGRTTIIRTPVAAPGQVVGAEGYYDIPAGVQTALRTGRFGGVRLSRAEIEALEQQYSQQEGQEIEVAGIKWGKRRGEGVPLGRTREGYTPRFRSAEPEADTYTADAAVERLVELSRTNPKEFIKLQKQLFARRFFDDSYYKGKNRKQIAFGVLDEATLDAFEGALGQATVTGDLDEVLWRPLTPEQKQAMFADITAERRADAGDDIIDEVDLEDQMMAVEKIFRSYSLPISPDSARMYAEKLIRGQRRAARRRKQPEPEEVPGIEFG